MVRLFYQDSKDPADALATALVRLKTVGELIELRDGRLASRVSCDAQVFQAHLDAGRLSEALELYQGPFLDGLALEVSSELEDWLLETREYLASRARDAHLSLGRQALSSEDLTRARYHAEAAFSLKSAPPPNPEQAKALQRLLVRTRSALLPRFLAEARELGLELRADPSRAPNNLPTLLTSFIGRDAERIELAGVVRQSDGRLITLHGPGGVGKTRLALQVAHDHLESELFEDGVYFIPLDGLSDASQVLPSIARALRIPTSPGQPPLEALQQGLDSKRLLIVLDNFEHVLEAAAFLSPLLSAAPNLVILITSRETLKLKAEWVLTLEGLALPLDSADPTLLEASDAVKLFSARLRHTNLMTTPGYDELLAIDRICRAVSGFPLAIELAAGAGFDDLVGRAQTLETDATALTTHLQDIRERHRSVQAAFEHSWRHLRDVEQTLLAQLAIFQGGFDVEAAQAVTGASETQLRAFTDKALLRQVEGRYSFHALVQQYLRGKLAQEHELEQAVRERHGLYYSRALGELNLAASGGASPELLAFMAREEGNLQAYIDWALDTEHYGQLTALAEPLLWHYPLQSRFQEGLALCRHVLNELPDSPETATVRAALLSSLSWLYQFAGSLEAAKEAAAEALELTLRQGELLQRMRAKDTLGQALYRSGHVEAGVEQLVQALELATAYGDPVRQLRVITNLGQAYALSDDVAHALSHLEEGLALCRRGLVPRGMDYVAFCIGLGLVRMLGGAYPGAAAILTEGITVGEEAGLVGQLPILHALLALVELERATPQTEDLQSIEGLCHEVLQTTRASGETLAHILALMILAYCRQPRLTEAQVFAMVHEALTVAWQSKDLFGLYWTLPQLLIVFYRSGNPGAVGEVAGFCETCPQVASWVRDRSARALGICLASARNPQVILAGQARGRSISSLVGPDRSTPLGLSHPTP